MDYTYKKIVNLLEQKQFYLGHIGRNQHIYINKQIEKVILVPIYENEEIPENVFMSIIKQAGIPKEEI
ncbi:MAG: type II toxin-antitoxin system HicA family toxin [Bacteroidota bacterium]|nr:type II toxin-antitoxin system HicA family toxin [Bacteroidota bacterium]